MHFFSLRKIQKIVEKEKPVEELHESRHGSETDVRGKTERVVISTRGEEKSCKAEGSARKHQNMNIEKTKSRTEGEGEGGDVN